MPIRYLDEAEPTIRFTDEQESGAWEHIKFVGDDAAKVSPREEQKRLETMTAEEFESLSPHEKGRAMQRLEELQFPDQRPDSIHMRPSVEAERSRKVLSLPEERVKLEVEAAPYNLREHIAMARARPNKKVFYWMERLPFSFTSGAQAGEVIHSAENINRGIGEIRDFENVAEYLVAAERLKAQGVAADVGDVVTRLPAFALEFAATGGAFSGARAAAQRAGLVALERAASRVAARNIGSRLARGALVGAARVPAAVAGVAAQTAANPQQIANNLMQSALDRVQFREGDQGEIETILKADDKGFWENLRNAYVKAGFEIGSERTGGLLVPLKAAILRRWFNGGIGRTPAALERAFKAAGWHGLIPEMFEERVNELGAPLYGEDYKPPTWRQLRTEAIAFSIPGAAGNLLGRRTPDVEKGARDATTTRQEEPQLERVQADARVEGQRQDRPDDATGRAARAPDLERGRVPGTTGQAGAPEAPAGPQVAAKPVLGVRILTTRGVAPDVAAFVAERAGDKAANETAEAYRARVNGLHDELGFKVAREVNPASSEASLRAAAAAEGFTEEQIQNTLEKARGADTQVAASNSALIQRLRDVQSRADIARAEAQTNPAPSEAQKEAGNYAKGKVTIDGLNISVENPKGSVRSGTDRQGRPWQVRMPATYGYILGTKGKDKDHLDIYLGPQAGRALPVIVVNQADPETGKFDEHKILYGFGSPAEALATYDGTFSDGSGPRRRQSVATFTPEQFKAWLKDGDHSKPAQASGLKKQPQNLTPARPVKVTSLRRGARAETKVAPAETKPPVPDTEPSSRETIPEKAETKQPERETAEAATETATAKPAPPAQPPVSEAPARDKIDDIRARREDIKKRLRAKFGQVGTGVDPEIATIAAELAVNYAEEGVVRFADFAKRVKDELPDIWERLKHYLGGAWRTAGEQNMDLDETTRAQAKSVIDALDAGTEAVTQPERKESEEQEESRIIRDARSIVVNATDPGQAYRKLVELYRRQPRLGTRTVTSKTNQAYSTPAPLAYLASRLADVRNGKMVVEPTAGNGMLLIDAPGTRIAANELDPARRERLQANFPHANVSGLDASTQEYHDSIKGAADRAIMNPPFGGVIEEGTTETKRFPIISASTAKATTPSIDLAIALNTLDALTPDGRAVVLIGAKTGSASAQFGSKESRARAYNRPEMLEFFKRFNVVDWFTVDGGLYEKMGAGWPVDVIVIDGKRPTPPSAQGGMARPWIEPPPVFETWESLEPKLYEKAAQQTPRRVEAPEPEPQRPPAAEPERRATGTTGLPAGGGGERVEGAGGGGVRPGSRAGGLARGPRVGRIEPAVAPESRPEGRREPLQETRGPAVVPESRPEPAGESAAVGQPAAERPAEAGEGRAPLDERTAVLNVPYVSVSKNADPKLVVPANIGDAMRRAVQNLEAEVGKPVDAYVAEKMGWTEKELFKHLSSAQIEAVGLFIRNAELRKTGLINSDQTGVGKGRVVASVIEYARRTGKIPVFITQGKHLYSDMAGRDLPSIGVKDFKPFITDAGYAYQNGEGAEVAVTHSAKERRETMREFTELGALPAEYDGVFTTYYQLQSDKPDNWKEKPNEKFKRKKKLAARPDGPRLAMLRKLAPDAIFILDEAHQAAGLDSDVGLSLQSILKDAAGVFYASATFAKRPDNLTLYSLGTGLKLAGLSPQEMADLFKSGGIPLQQALTSMLADEGEFVRREQDMSGVKVGFKRVSASPEQEAEQADTYTSFLRDLHTLSDMVNSAAEQRADAENQVRPEEAQVDLTSVNFGARLFNLSNQYLFSLRADATGREAVAALRRGQKPFIAVYNTMAGPIADLQTRGLPLTFGGLLRREMAKMLTLKIKDPAAEADPARGLKKGERLLELKPEDLPDGGAFYRQLEQQIQNTDFGAMPISPIDAIKRSISSATDPRTGRNYTVGEITAREGEIDESGGVVTVSKREKRDRNKVLFDYNNGALDVVLVNGSGSTGLSAHADPRFKDQRQRYMIVAQAAPDINVFMQMLGRVMRFGQTSLPEFSILTTNLAAERRFMTMLRGKLTSLNANTSADTESGLTQGGLADDIFNQIGDEIVAEVIQAHPELASLARIDLPDREEEGGGLDNYARYATGRFVLLPNDDAAKLWNDIGELYTSRIRALDEAGENPLKANVQDLRAQTTGTAVIEDAKGKTAFDGPVTLDRVNIQPARKPYTHQEATEAAEASEDENRGRVRDWNEKQRAAGKERLETMARREATDEQIDRTREALRKVQENVVVAQSLLGKVVAVDPTGSGTPAFYAVPIGLELRSKETGDFSSSSKHTLKLATNTLRRTIHLPLSQLDSLKEVEGAEAEAVFDENSESTTTRYIAGTNLLRAYSVAGKLSGNITRPAVTIYTTRDGQLKTGVLLGAAFNPAQAGQAARRQIISHADMDAAIQSGTPLVAGLVKITGHQVRVPSGSVARPIWGDRQFSGFFESDPVERGGEFRGTLRPGAGRYLFDFLRSKGMSVFEQKEATAEPITFKAPAGQPSDVANRIADSLDKLKSGQKPGQLHAFGVLPLVWDQAIAIAQRLIRAGGKAADAVAAALAHIRGNHKGQWDETGARAALERASQEQPTESSSVPEPARQTPEFKANVELADELGRIRAEDDHPAATGDGVQTKVGNVNDVVLSRPGLNAAVRDDSVRHAEETLNEAGLKIQRARDGLWTLDPAAGDQEAAGQRLPELLRREILKARAENASERIANLLNSVVVHLGRDGNRNFSQGLKNRLYALAQGERSGFGRALGALAMWGRVLANVAMNPSLHLNRLYFEGYGGQLATDVVDEANEEAAKEPATTDEEKQAARKKALDKIIQSLSKKDRVALRKHRPLWRKIEQWAESGLFDPGPALETIAAAQGWTIPTEEQKAQMRAWAEKEQRLRTPTQRQIDAAGGDVAKATREAERGTESERIALIKNMQATWARWSQPISVRRWLRDRTVAQNNAKAVNEFVAANLLAKAGFAVRQWIDVAMTSLPLNAVNRALAHTLERVEDAGGFNKESLGELQDSLKEMFVARIASLKATVRQMERVARGKTDRRALDRMSQSIGLFERWRVKADELEAKGNKAGSNALRLAGVLQIGFRVAATFDALSSEGLEWQEMRHQLATALREQGKTRAEVALQLDDVFGGTRLDMAQALAEVRAIKHERGEPLDDKAIQQDAWGLVRSRAYDRMRELTGGTVDFESENSQLRELHAWNLPETGGPGGIVASLVNVPKRKLEEVGIPSGGLFSFGNAMGIAANRMATFAGLGLFPRLFGDSPWYQGERNIRQRRIEALQGLAAMGLMVGLAAAGKIIVHTKYPDDKDEKELFIRQGHKLNTVEFRNDDGSWIEYPIQMAPFTYIAPHLYMIGAVQDRLHKQAKEQEKLNAEAARTGTTPGKAAPLSAADVPQVLAQGMYGLLSGGRTASGAIQSFSDYGEFNLNKATARVASPYVPLLPAWQEAARAMGVSVDSKSASVLQQMVPVPGMVRQRVNSLGDPMVNPNDAARVLQTLTGGIGYGNDKAGDDSHAYRQIMAAGFAVPNVARSKAFNVNGELRPLKPQEFEDYIVARGKAFKSELDGVDVGGLLEEETRARVRTAYERANTTALRSVGVTVTDRRGRTASVAVARTPSGSTVGNVRLTGEDRIGPVGGARYGGLRRARLSRRSRRGRLGRGRLSRGSRLRQPRLGRLRRRGLRRAA